MRQAAGGTGAKSAGAEAREQQLARMAPEVASSPILAVGDLGLARSRQVKKAAQLAGGFGTVAEDVGGFTRMRGLLP